MNDIANEQDRAEGALLGLAIGDALGTVVEFLPRDTYEPVTEMGRTRTWRAGTALGQFIAEAKGLGAFNLQPGEWTDDTAQALCLADSLLFDPNLDYKDLMERFSRWEKEGYNSHNGKCFDCGFTTMDSIERYRQTGNPVAGHSSPTRAGNGSIMRFSPVAIRWHNNEAKAIEVAIKQSEVTHRAPQCLIASGLLASILVNAIKTGDKEDSIRNRILPSGDSTLIRQGEWRTRTRDQIKSTGYVVDTLEAALWAVYNTDNFKDAVLLAVNLGDDADTVGAVTGQIAGALYGGSSIPIDWLKQLAWVDKIEEKAKLLYEAGKNGI